MILWLTEELGTSSWGEASKYKDVQLVDVRDLVDKSGNTRDVLELKISSALTHLQQGKKVVICCDYGMSRSNAVAVGVLAKYKSISFDEALNQMLAKTNFAHIKLSVLSEVRLLISNLQNNAMLTKSNRTLLLTGGAGFIGSSINDELRTKYCVISPTHQELDLYTDVISLDRLVRQHGVDTLLHFANPHVNTTNESMGTTMVMLKNVLDVCLDNSLFLIYLSGWEIYSGYKTTNLIVNESVSPLPGGTYGYTKLFAEELLNHYRENYGLSCTILRSSPVYGSTSPGPRFIWNVFEKVFQNREIVTHEYMNGFPALDLLYIDDLKRAIHAAVSKSVPGTFNIGTGVVTTTNDLAKIIVAETNSKSTIRHQRVNACTAVIAMDSSLAHKTLDWEPTISIEQGIKSIVNEKFLTRVPYINNCHS